MTLMLVEYAPCGCRVSALLPGRAAGEQAVREMEDEAALNGNQVREEEHETIGAQRCPQHQQLAEAPPGTPMYDLRTVEDFLAVPPEKLGACLVDFAWYVQTIQNAKANGFKILHDAAQVFRWLDDGKHVGKRTLTDAKTGQQVAEHVEEFAPPEGAPAEATTSACACAAIQRQDPRRHFKGCPERQDLPEADQAAIDQANAQAEPKQALGWLQEQEEALGAAVLHWHERVHDGGPMGECLWKECRSAQAGIANLRALVNAPLPAQDVSEVMQDDMAHLLRVMGLGDHARPESPHEVMKREVIPELLRWKKDQEHLEARRTRAKQLEDALHQARTQLDRARGFAGYQGGPLAEPWTQHVLMNASHVLGYSICEVPVFGPEQAPMDCDCRDADAERCGWGGPEVARCGCPHHRKRPAPEAVPGDSSGPNVGLNLRARALQLVDALAEPCGVSMDDRKELRFIVRHFLG